MPAHPAPHRDTEAALDSGNDHIKVGAVLGSYGLVRRMPKDLVQDGRLGIIGGDR